VTGRFELKDEESVCAALRIIQWTSDPPAPYSQLPHTRTETTLRKFSPGGANEISPALQCWEKWGK
jgi:hypothetical protein